MVYEMIRKRISDTVPFARHIGVEVLSVGDGVSECTVQLKPELLNHIGSAHAGVIFTLAETASGGAMGGALAPFMMEARPVVSNSSMEFLKVGKTTLTAHGKTEDDPAELRENLKTEGKIIFNVIVTIKDEEENDISVVKVTWHVSLKK
ncbi:MAG: PaaI family thioesterase [Methyloligellaceae bacterium]